MISFIPNSSATPFHPTKIMKTRTRIHLKTLPVIAMLGAAVLPQLPTSLIAAEEGGSDEILDSLAAAAERFVDAFNGRDAAAVAALFAPAGEMIEADGTIVTGREEIAAYHVALFSGEAVPQVALEASDVRLIAPGVAVEEGALHFTIANDEPVRTITYKATHARQEDGSWRIASSRSLAETTAPSERIKPLHWLIGEWTHERGDGTRIDMVIDLDDRENHLLGEALITDAWQGAHLTQLRIGWHPATSSIYWWTSDSEGGNAAGPWARRGDEWIVHTTGVTSDGEASASAQTLARDGDTMVWTATHRMLAGEALPDLTYRFARRAPDPLSLVDDGDAPAPEPASNPDGE